MTETPLDDASETHEIDVEAVAEPTFHERMERLMSTCAWGMLSLAFFMLAYGYLEAWFELRERPATYMFTIFAIWLTTLSLLGFAFAYMIRNPDRKL